MNTMNMNQITLSDHVVDRMINKWSDDPDDYTYDVVQYYVNMGWNMERVNGRPRFTYYTIPENQITFFLLSL